jgi:hypothetical protein
MIKRLDSSTHQREIVEAIATWTENLRDVISASAGLHDAVINSAQCPPEPIAEQVQRLAASLRYQSLEVSLRDFADAIAHPTCDFVVAALIIASQNQARDVSELLTHLAQCARVECDLYIRIWVSRARSRSAIRIVNGAMAFFFGGMLLFSSDYLAPFFTLQGVFVLVGIASVVGGSILAMAQIAQIELPQRFLSTRNIGEFG